MRCFCDRAACAPRWCSFIWAICRLPQEAGEEFPFHTLVKFQIDWARTTGPFQWPTLCQVKSITSTENHQKKCLHAVCTGDVEDLHLILTEEDEEKVKLKNKSNYLVKIDVRVETKDLQPHRWAQCKENAQQRSWISPGRDVPVPGSDSASELPFPNLSWQKHSEPWLCDDLHAVTFICIAVKHRYRLSTLCCTTGTERGKQWVESGLQEVEMSKRWGVRKTNSFTMFCFNNRL